MTYSAVFVDAGYLFAQGSVALTGAKRNRSELRLNEAAAVAALDKLVHQKSEGCRLLRIYWYDAPLHTGMTAQQSSLAVLDRVKMRLGVLNGQGQQKGVDSLIVTDLIELARNRSITDALLVSGDEDVRIGAQIAQNYGVSIHLLGIHPARGSQSPLLRQEADTITEWDASVVGTFLSAVAAPSISARPPVSGEGEAIQSSAQEGEIIANVIKGLLAELSTKDLNDLRTFWATKPGLPPELDRPMLGRCRDGFSRELTPNERRSARAQFVEAIKALPAYTASA
ncbi:NYN domain-containing protein [Sphingomonas sp. 2R-10]|uniref:NYN domain-containing protein n=1 Tax=Sphingomonas sp. 2R-10 TaxID=3045148 RepID=UPI000F78122C|nr:NYN domain-containing protein [Sphingomonas sp. 2R-10]MDJ0278700.1 NYN domain-containing protein [Sphingomonas sp. 2R-10]